MRALRPQRRQHPLPVDALPSRANAANLQRQSPETTMPAHARVLRPVFLSALLLALASPTPAQFPQQHVTRMSVWRGPDNLSSEDVWGYRAPDGREIAI